MPAAAEARLEQRAHRSRGMGVARGADTPRACIRQRNPSRKEPPQMQDQPNPARPGQADARKRCPACRQFKSVNDFYTTPKGKPSGYCKSCQKTISRGSRRRRTAAIRALIALYPEEWQTALGAAGDNTASGGGPDVA